MLTLEKVKTIDKGEINEYKPVLYRSKKINKPRPLSAEENNVLALIETEDNE
jgi:hypothetical protein